MGPFQPASTGTVERMEVPELVVADAAAWQHWLRRHHGQSPGVWLVLAKKGTVDPTALSYDQALDEAICFGWIDGQTGRRDSTTFRRRFTPRKARSPWSQRNTAIAERLIATGRMQPAGEAEIAGAKGDGRWDAAYASQSRIEVPDDLAIALAAQPRHWRCSRSSPAKIDTPCSTELATPRKRRPERGASSSSWPCWPGEKRSIRRLVPSPTEARRPESSLPGATGLNGDS